jgi:hypothetical protein
MEATQLIDCETVFGKDNEVICGTNPESGRYEVCTADDLLTEEEIGMRNLCINMIIEAGCESFLMDAVHAAAKRLGTPKYVLDLIMEWAGFVPRGE